MGGEMRLVRTLAIALIFASPLVAQTAQQHGIQTADLDKK